MRKRIFLPAVLVLSGLPFLLWGKAPLGEVGLQVKAWVKPIRLSRQQQGQVILKFKIPENLRVKPLPTFIIEFEPSDGALFSKNFFTASDLSIEILEDNDQEYLNLAQPIEISFTVPLEAPRGRHIIRGKIKYFAYSINESWCLKTTAKFETYFYTRSSIYRKKRAK